ncbi:hypothetical protein ACQWHS_25200, partial [Salmonella enterica subsp. enterica serovar Infantis]
MSALTGGMPFYFTGDLAVLRFLCFTGLSLHFFYTIPITLKKAGFKNEFRIENFKKNIYYRANLN